MALTSGIRLGPHESAVQIGVGGVGEVNPARESNSALPKC